MKHRFMIYKLKFLIGAILLMLPVTLRAQCSGSWSSIGTLNYLCADGPFLQFNPGPNICPSAPQSTFTFTSPVQSVKMIFSAFGSLTNPGESRMSVYLNNSEIDLNQACRIVLGCQVPIGEYSISNGCLVDSISGADGGISGAIYLIAASFGLPSITSIGVAVSEPGASGTIFELDSCNYMFGCTTGFGELTSDKKVIYQNPFMDNLTITLQKQNIKQAIFIIKNISGQTVFIEQENNLSGTRTKTIDLSFLSNGIYFLEINLNGERMVRKVVKE